MNIGTFDMICAHGINRFSTTCTACDAAVKRMHEAGRRLAARLDAIVLIALLAPTPPSAIDGETCKLVGHRTVVVPDPYRPGPLTICTRCGLRTPWDTARAQDVQDIINRVAGEVGAGIFLSQSNA